MILYITVNERNIGALKFVEVEKDACYWNLKKMETKASRV